MIMPRNLDAVPKPAQPVRRPIPARRVDLAIVGAVAAAAALRLLALGERPLAPAEAPLWAAAAGGVDAFPSGPLFAPLVTACFTAIVGANELTVRWPAAAAGVLLVAGIAPLARRLGGAPLARWAAWLAATSPYLIFYDRTATPLALTSLLALLAIWWYLFRPTGRPRAVAGFTGAMLLLALTSGAVLPMALAQAAFLWVRRAGASAWRRWLFGLGVALAGTLTWTLPSVGRVTLAVDTSHNLASETSALAFKVISPFIAFALGESLPVSQPIGLAGVLLMVWLTSLGMRRLARPGRQFVFVFLLLPVFWTATVTAILAAPTSAGGISAMVGYAWPAFGLVVAAGVVALSSGVRRLAYAGLVAVAAFSLGGYAHGRAIAQPRFALPIDDVLHFIEARAEPGDVVLADSHSMVAHYARRHPATVPVIDLGNADAVRALLAGEPPRRLWHAAGPNGGSSDEPAELNRWIAAQYRGVETRLYAEPDPGMAAFKGWLLGTAPEGPGLVLTLFERR
jgi:hypothetical protein